jgi:hypothetical protein
LFVLELWWRLTSPKVRSWFIGAGLFFIFYLSYILSVKIGLISLGHD